MIDDINDNAELETTCPYTAIINPVHVIYCYPFPNDDYVWGLTKAPCWIHRKFMSLFFGFRWKKDEA